MISLDESIKHCEKVAEELEKRGLIHCDSMEDTMKAAECRECASEHRQLAEWLRELKAYKGLSTYNRPCKCYECDYEDSEYYCDDCIWHFVDKFKLKEVNADGRTC